MACSAMHVFANDGVYYTSGNFLVPVSETDISVVKEILTITIGEDSMATVDVYYEFENPRKPKTVTMAFEATPPYNTWNRSVNRNGVHPYIKDFTVTMNDKQLDYSNALVATRFDANVYKADFKPLDLSQWKTYGEVPDSILPEPDALYNDALDSLTAFSYAYFFEAPFVRGKNTVHHTYRYQMSYNIMEKFNIPYWLTPATRWANGQVDDFTLRIKSEGYTEFCLADSLFCQSEFTSSKGNKPHHIKLDNGDKVLYSQIDPDDTIEWHTTNFRPVADMSINYPIWEGMAAADRWRTSAKVVINAGGEVMRYTGECDDSYFVNVQDWGFVPKEGCRVAEYNAANGQGCVVPDIEKGFINVRQRPTANSKVIAKIEVVEGDIPEVFDCKGLVAPIDNTYTKWYIIEIDGKKGYVSSDLMVWDAINTY